MAPWVCCAFKPRARSQWAPSSCGSVGASEYFRGHHLSLVPEQITAWLSSLLSDIPNRLQGSEINFKDERDFETLVRSFLWQFKNPCLSCRVDISETRTEPKRKRFRWFLRTERIISHVFSQKAKWWSLYAAGRWPCLCSTSCNISSGYRLAVWQLGRERAARGKTWKLSFILPLVNSNELLKRGGMVIASYKDTDPIPFPNVVPTLKTFWHVLFRFHYFVSPLSQISICCASLLFWK